MVRRTLQLHTFFPNDNVVLVVAVISIAKPSIGFKFELHELMAKLSFVAGAAIDYSGELLKW